jgi:hypothetical protein
VPYLVGETAQSQGEMAKNEAHMQQQGVPSLRHPLRQPVAHRPHRPLRVPQPSFPQPLKMVVLFAMTRSRNAYTTTRLCNACGIRHARQVKQDQARQSQSRTTSAVSTPGGVCSISPSRLPQLRASVLFLLRSTNLTNSFVLETVLHPPLWFWLASQVSALLPLAFIFIPAFVGAPCRGARAVLAYG